MLRFAVLSFLIFSFFCLKGQREVHTFYDLTTADNLTSSQYTHYVFQDRQGFVWISSVSGLNRFDGHRVKQYHADPESPYALNSEFASQSDFYEDDSGNLWFNNKNCLIQYVRKEDNFRRHYFNLPSGDVATEYYFWSYLDKVENELYVSANRHLFVLDVTDSSKKTLVDSVFVGVQDRMFRLSEDRLILFRQREKSTALDIRYYENHTRISQNYIKPPGNVIIGGVWLVEDNNVLVTTSGGLFLLDLETLEWKGLSNEFEGRTILGLKGMEQLPLGRWLIHTDKGNLFIYDLKKKEYETQIWTKSSGSVVPLTEDTETVTVDSNQNIWVCTVGEGVKYGSLIKPKFSTYLSNKLLDDRHVRSICENMDGEIFALLPKQVIQMSATDTQYYRLPIGENYLDDSMEIFADSKGRVWVGNLSELFLLDTALHEFKAIDLLPTTSSIRSPGYTFISEMLDHDLLFGPNQVGLFTVDQDLSKSKWIDSTLDRTSLMLLGETEEFVHVSYDDDLKLGRFDSAGITIDSVVVNFGFAPSGFVDKDANRYILGTARGIWAVESTPEGWRVTQDTIVGDGIIISSLCLDEEGGIWFASSRGLGYYNRGNEKVNYYSMADGVAGNDFSHDAVLAHTDGRIIFGGASGITVFYPDDIYPTVAKPRPTITSISINDDLNIFVDYSPPNEKNASLVTSLRLPYELNSIDLEISAMEYSDPANCKFQYQLLGASNENKRPITFEPKISFTNLGVGKYILKIWAWNSDGVKSEFSRNLRITILPPWYQTWLAYTGYALTIFGIAFTIFWLYLMRVREKERGQIRVANYETQVAKAQARAAKTETSVLRLQMNPHFIFNSLNAVNAFLWKGNKLEANEYLARFALLMRETLNRSTQTLSRLEDTIYSLENYLETEQMRLGDKMSYKFEVDETLDTFSVYFPTMMLQPFVENAIWHGISGLEGQGLITIRFQPDRGRGVLIAEVEDNGRGRQQAAKRNTGHASKSLGITQRRLDLLNMALSPASETSTAPARRRPKKEDNSAIEISLDPIAEMKIIDLLQADGSAGGTLVRLTLPLKYPKTYARDNS